MGKILFNGEITDRERLIDIEDRAYQFGDGIYEVIGIYDGKSFLMDEHMERLQRSADEIQIDLQISVDELAAQLEQLIEKNGVVEGIVYLQVSRGVAPRTHEFPVEKVSPTIVAYTRSVPDFTDIQDNGIKVILEKDIRWLRCDIKTVNLLPNTLTKQKAVEKGAFEAILHRDEVVTEASSANIFIVKDGELYTHPANNLILNGITRQQVISFCRELDIKVHEQTYTVDDMFAADEVILTATKVDVLPIVQIEDKMINNGKVGSISKRLVERFRTTTNNL